jgi:hypothetical protein
VLAWASSAHRADLVVGPMGTYVRARRGRIASAGPPGPAQSLEKEIIMFGKKSVAGLMLLCALALSAVAAQGASAGTGTTLVTCKKGGTTKDFAQAHCESGDHVELGKGEYSHFKVANGVPTTVSGTNTGLGTNTETTIKPVLTSTNGGVNFEIQCESVISTGQIENSEPETEKHTITGKEIKVHYTGCRVTAPAFAVQECEIENETITTNELTSMDVGDTIEFFPPAAGAQAGIFANVVVTHCKSEALRGNKAVKGKVVATPNGSTLGISIKKEVGSPLSFGGNPAGLTQTETLKGKKTGGSETPEPLSVTTTPLNLGG